MTLTSRPVRRATCAVIGLSALLLTTLAGPADAKPVVPENPKPLTAAPKVVKRDASSAAAEAKAPTGDRLGAQDRRILSEARAAGKKTVTTLVATDRGAAPAVARRLADLGGSVGYRNDKLGYVRAIVPVGAVERAATLRGVDSFDLNAAVALIDPRANVGAGSVKAAAVKAPDKSTPANNPYLPTNEIEATSFVQQHPTWDGRGVTIGVVDSGVDLDHPALQTTTTGERKIVDWVTATDPLADGDASWRAMITEVAGPTFTASGRTWTAPAGSYRFNRFLESATAGSQFESDVNRDGDQTDAWGILYRPSDGAVWVDVDQDGDFTDETLMRPYAEDHQINHFGTDDPASAVRESVPFVIQYRKDVSLAPAGLTGAADFVNIGIVADEHGSHVAGITAANGLFGGAMNGAAPGAKIVSTRVCVFTGGCTSVALIEGVIDLVEVSHVDVINISIGGLPALNDGNTTRAVIYNRLIAESGVQLFISAGNNGPGLNTVGDPSVISNVVSVAASLSKATALANYGAEVSAAHAIFNFSSRGPREDGGLKPSISAPGAAVSTTPLWQPGVSVTETGYTLPSGYSMLNGTSMAAPQATGGAALLLSAGRATDTAITSAQLRTAISSSARFDPAISAAAQGMGEMGVSRAWSLLSQGTKLVPGRYSVSAPVCTPLSFLLAVPDRGQGLYNRCAADDGGHAAGQSKTYTVRITRLSGGGGGRTHSLSWLGNDGTFSTQRTVRLPLGRPVSIKVKAVPTAGAHSAILKIDDLRTAGVDGQVSAVVVAATDPVKPSFTISPLGPGRTFPDPELLHHRPRGRPGAAGEPVRSRGRQPDPVPRVQPVRGGHRGQLEPELLHQPAARGRL